MEEDEELEEEEEEMVPLKRPAARRPEPKKEPTPKAKVVATPKSEATRQRKAPIAMPDVAAGPQERKSSVAADTVKPEEVDSQVGSAEPSDTAAPTVVAEQGEETPALKRLRTESQWPLERNWFPLFFNSYQPQSKYIDPMEVAERNTFGEIRIYYAVCFDLKPSA